MGGKVMICYGRGKVGREFWHEMGTACLAFVFEAIPFLIFSLIMGLLWFMGITVFTMTISSF